MELVKTLVEDYPLFRIFLMLRDKVQWLSMKIEYSIKLNNSGRNSAETNRESNSS